MGYRRYYAHWFGSRTFFSPDFPYMVRGMPDCRHRCRFGFDGIFILQKSLELLKSGILSNQTFQPNTSPRKTKENLDDPFF